MRKLFLTVLSLPNTVANWFTLKRKHVAYGRGLHVNGRLRLHGNGTFLFGNNVTIHSSADANPAAGGERTHLTVGNGAVLQIGNGCGLSNCAVTAMCRVELEDNVLIGANTMIADTDFHSAVYEERITGDDSTAKTAAVLIREGAFVGARCIILKGVTIGRGAVVGAGSVVTKSIPECEVWAGNPARFIKSIK